METVNIVWTLVNLAMSGALVALAVIIVLRYQNHLSLPRELAARAGLEVDDYERLARADALAAGRGVPAATAAGAPVEEHEEAEFGPRSEILTEAALGRLGRPPE